MLHNHCWYLQCKVPQQYLCHTAVAKGTCNIYWTHLIPHSMLINYHYETGSNACHQELCIQGVCNQGSNHHDRHTCQPQTEQTLNMLSSIQFKLEAHILMQHKVVCSKAGRYLSTNQYHSRSPTEFVNGRAKGMSIIMTNPGLGLP